MSIFSAKYRPLAKEGLRCVFRTITFKPCDTGLDDQIKATAVSGAFKVHPALAKFTNKNFTALSWVFVILTFASFILTAQAVWNLATVGTCDPANPSGCVVNQIRGDYGFFGGISGFVSEILNPPVAPTALDGITAGNPNAKVVIVEFGCYTCPYTGEAEPVVKELLKEYNSSSNDKSIYYVFKPFPIETHKYSNEAARAILCARNQGKQTDLQDRIFKSQDACTSDGVLMIKQLANESGLNMTAFNACLDGNQTGAELARYIQEGHDSYIQRTPTFFINGKYYAGPQTIETFRAEITEARGRAS